MRNRSRVLVGAMVLLLGLVALALCSRRACTLRSHTPPTYQGFVRDIDGPLAGVRVRYKSDTESILTDAQGGFHLPRGPHGSGRVTAWKEGYLIGGASLDDHPLL